MTIWHYQKCVRRGAKGAESVWIMKTKNTFYIFITHSLSRNIGAYSWPHLSCIAGKWGGPMMIMLSYLFASVYPGIYQNLLVIFCPVMFNIKALVVERGSSALYRAPERTASSVSSLSHSPEPPLLLCVCVSNSPLPIVLIKYNNTNSAEIINSK